MGRYILFPLGLLGIVEKSPRVSGGVPLILILLLFVEVMMSE